ncbi:hypothetical protein KC326_g40 [Hortaea werneckii]|nr:hypothetical protein KC326_g40 [Hortaea werneckii]
MGKDFPLSSYFAFPSALDRLSIICEVPSCARPLKVWASPDVAYACRRDVSLKEYSHGWCAGQCSARIL